MSKFCSADIQLNLSEILNVTIIMTDDQVIFQSSLQVGSKGFSDIRKGLEYNETRGIVA